LGISKVFIVLSINNKVQEKGNRYMQKIREKPQNLSEDDLGLILWKLESLEKFYPCYTSLMKKD
jgi:hypothetical protein